MPKAESTDLPSGVNAKVEFPDPVSGAMGMVRTLLMVKRSLSMQLDHERWAGELTVRPACAQAEQGPDRVPRLDDEVTFAAIMLSAYVQGKKPLRFRIEHEGWIGELRIHATG